MSYLYLLFLRFDLESARIPHGFSGIQVKFCYLCFFVKVTRNEPDGLQVHSLENHSFCYYLGTWTEPGFHMDSLESRLYTPGKFPYLGTLPGIHVDSLDPAWIQPGSMEAWGRVKY